MSVEEVLREAIEEGLHVTLTIDPPDGSEPFTKRVLPTCLTPNGQLTCQHRDGTNWTLYTEFICHAEIL